MNPIPDVTPGAADQQPDNPQLPPIVTRALAVAVLQQAVAISSTTWRHLCGVSSYCFSRLTGRPSRLSARLPYLENSVDQLRLLVGYGALGFGGYIVVSLAVVVLLLLLSVSRSTLPASSRPGGTENLAPNTRQQSHTGADVALAGGTLERVEVLSKRNSEFISRAAIHRKTIHESTDLDELENAQFALAKLCFDEDDALRNLSPSNVDRELFGWQLKLAAHFLRRSVNFAALQRVMSQTKTLVKYYSSERALVESFARGFDGDPFGTTQDGFEKQHRLQEEWDNLMKEQSGLDKQFAELSAERSQLLLAMDARYRWSQAKR